MNHVRNAFLTLAVTLLLAFAAHADHHADPREVYGRLIAPCCWNQTLDIHDSVLSTQLRLEIAQRLRRGETTLSIEDDMARRFGERVRAVPRASDPRVAMALTVVSAMLIALIALLLVARSWSRRRTQREGSFAEELASAAGPGDEYDARLDRELTRADAIAR